VFFPFSFRKYGILKRGAHYLFSEKEPEEEAEELVLLRKLLF